MVAALRRVAGHLWPLVYDQKLVQFDKFVNVGPQFLKFVKGIDWHSTGVWSPKPQTRVLDQRRGTMRLSRAFAHTRPGAHGAANIRWLAFSL